MHYPELGCKCAGKLLVRIDTGRSIKAGNYTASNGDVWVYDMLYQGKLWHMLYWAARGIMQLPVHPLLFMSFELH